MSSPAPDQKPAPQKGPHNLTATLSAWLRGMGFTVLEGGGLVPTSLSANWLAPDGIRYQVCYDSQLSGGTFQVLAANGPDDSGLLPLVFNAEVNRAREARFLLLSNTFYKAARQAALAAGTLQPA